MRGKKPSRMQMVRSLLLARGITLQEFADEYGFNILTVRSAINLHWGKTTRPRGDIICAILNALEAIVSREGNRMAA